METEQSNTESNIHMGNYLRKVLYEKGYNPGRFADTFGFARNVITEATKKQTISPSLLLRIGHALKIDLYGMFYPISGEAPKVEDITPIYEVSAPQHEDHKVGTVMVALDLSNPVHLDFLMGYIPKR